MTTDLETRLSDHYIDVAAQLELPEMSLDELLAGASDATVTHRSPRGDRPAATRWLAIAAAVLLLVVGLGLLTRRGDDPRSTVVDRPATLLSVADEIGDDEWVIAGLLPAGVAWMYASVSTDSPPSIGDRSVLYGNERASGTFERMRISIGTPPAPEGAETVTIAGTDWKVDTPASGPWTATRQVGTTSVSISDSGPFEQEDRDVIAGLVVVPVEELPFSPLGDVADALEVARFESNGIVAVFSAQESNGYWCTWVEGSGGCGRGIDASAAVTIEAGSATVAAGAATAEVIMAGTVSADSARVEVEFGEGVVIEVTPTDLSGRFDRKFWVAGAVTPADRRPPVEVRAYDADDRLLGTGTDT